MDKSKIVLSLIGLGALIVPAILLVVFTGGSSEKLSDTSGERQINQSNVKDVFNKAPAPPKAIRLPSPSPASPSAEVEPEGSNSAQ